MRGLPHRRPPCSRGAEGVRTGHAEWRGDSWGPKAQCGSVLPTRSVSDGSVGGRILPRLRNGADPRATGPCRWEPA